MLAQGAHDRIAFGHLDRRPAVDRIDQPIPLARQPFYLPLKYFPVDPAYAVTASFTPAAMRTPLQMPTSTGKLRDMEQVGTLSFTLKGQLLGKAVEALPGEIN